MKTRDLPHQQPCTEWSKRILLLSLLGIAYLTLFPFEFHSAPALATAGSPFLLGISLKQPRAMDFFLNVLLFVPFGFGLAANRHRRAGSRWISFLLALSLGAAVSYLVEFLQLYIPTRDSGWEDVISNSLGSVGGFLLFELCGAAILLKLTKWEQLMEGWFSPRRTALLLVIYFAACFGFSIQLQKETRLSNWDPQCILFVGNDASGTDPWKGQVFLLQIWNRALPGKAVEQMARRESPNDSSTGLLGTYDFTGGAPFLDKNNFLPKLSWAADSPQPMNSGALNLDGRSWLSSSTAAETLTREIKKSNSFTVHVVCSPAAKEDARGHIVSLSQVDDNVNLSLRQEGKDLLFWFRNPLSETHSLLVWDVPGAFETGKVRDIVVSYDGSEAFVYLDGNRVPRTYRLSPGASQAHKFSYIQTAELKGYIVVYYTLIFLPAGVLLGLASRNWTGNQFLGQWMIALSLAVPAVLLETLLASVSKRTILAGNVALSLILGLAGVMLINADRGHKISSHVS